MGAGTATQSGEEATQVTIKLSRGQTTVWDWDAASGTYLRSDGSRASVSDTGVRHAARNVVILKTDSRASATDANVPETFLVGEGEAVVATGGRVVTGRWSQASVHDLPVLTTDAGEVITLDPGATWVHPVPRASGSWSVAGAAAEG